MIYYTYPRVIKAMRYDGTNLEEIKKFNDEVPNKQISSEDLFYTRKDGQLMMVTLGCHWEFNVGDYVILSRGQLEPSSKDVFEGLYHELPDQQQQLIFDVSKVWSKIC